MLNKIHFPLVSSFRFFLPKIHAPTGGLQKGDWGIHTRGLAGDMLAGGRLGWASLQGNCIKGGLNEIKGRKAGKWELRMYGLW